MAIDISSIIQNHLIEEGTVEGAAEGAAEGAVEGVVEGEGTSSSNGLGVDFSTVIENMETDIEAEADEPFLSESELQAIRGAIVSGVVAAHV